MYEFVLILVKIRMQMWENTEFWPAFLDRANPEPSVSLSSPSPCDCRRRHDVTAPVSSVDHVHAGRCATPDRPPWLLVLDILTEFECDFRLACVTVLVCLSISVPLQLHNPTHLFFTTSEEALYVEMLSVRLCVLWWGRQYVTCTEVTEIKPMVCEMTTPDTLLVCSLTPPPPSRPFAELSKLWALVASEYSYMLISTKIAMNRMASSLEESRGTYAEERSKIFRPRCGGCSCMGLLPWPQFNNMA